MFIDNELMDFKIRRNADIKYLKQMLVNKKITRSMIEKHLNSYLCCISLQDCELFQKYFEAEIDDTDKDIHSQRYNQIISSVNEFIRIKKNARY